MINTALVNAHISQVGILLLVVRYVPSVWITSLETQEYMEIKNPVII